MADQNVNRGLLDEVALTELLGALRVEPSKRGDRFVETIYSHIQNIEFTQQLNHEQQLLFARTARYAYGRCGVPIVTQGDRVEPNALFSIVLTGSLGVFKLQQGRPSPSQQASLEGALEPGITEVEDVYGSHVATLHAGDTFGEAALIKMAEPLDELGGEVPMRNASVAPLEPTHLMVLRFTDFTEMMRIGDSQLVFAPEHTEAILSKEPQNRTLEDIQFVATSLRRFKCFSSLPGAVMEEVVRHLRRRQYNSESIVREEGGRLVPEFCVVLRGTVAAHVRTQEAAPAGGSPNAGLQQSSASSVHSAGRPHTPAKRSLLSAVTATTRLLSAQPHTSVPDRDSASPARPATAPAVREDTAATDADAPLKPSAKPSRMGSLLRKAVQKYVE